MIKLSDKIHIALSLISALTLIILIVNYISDEVNKLELSDEAIQGMGLGGALLVIGLFMGFLYVFGWFYEKIFNLLNIK